MHLPEKGKFSAYTPKSDFFPFSYLFSGSNLRGWKQGSPNKI